MYDFKVSKVLLRANMLINIRIKNHTKLIDKQKITIIHHAQISGVFGVDFRMLQFINAVDKVGLDS